MLDTTMGSRTAHTSPATLINYALEYFGSEQYYSDKFQDEAYLFIPFDENYYQAMAKVMEKRFANWQGQSFDEATLEPSDLAEAMMEYLDCECTYFPSMTDDDPHHVGIQLCQTGKCQRGLCAGFD